MTLTTTRPNRRRRFATTLASAGAAAALIAGPALSPGAAEAAEPGSGPIGSAGCFAGDRTVVDDGGVLADCSDSEPSPLAALGDALLGLVAPNLGLSLSDLNGAGVIFLGDSKINGTGLAGAVSLMATSRATADDYLSGALSFGFGEGSAATSHAHFGSLSTALAFGGEAVAHSLPAGVALAATVGAEDVTATATALGGIAAALNVSDDGQQTFGPASNQAVCTALYATASVTQGGDNVNSCTGVLFIFQKSQVGDGPVVYAIKNPLDLKLTGILPPETVSIFSMLTSGMGMPDALSDILGLKIIPAFGSDLIRIEMGADGPKIGTGISDWLGGLAGQAGDALGATRSAAATTIADRQVPAGTEALSSTVLDDAQARPAAPSSDPAPVEDAPVEEAPAADAPVVDTPAADSSADDAAADTAAAGTPADITPTAGTSTTGDASGDTATDSPAETPADTGTPTGGLDLG
ncbi:hypothetical protein [Gordonia sp. FQ]|uniref:hypothetical protein n=1 Tax=Gordonia sp. FQ TaxID=3446634 RepID=UPI003F852117